MFSRRTSQRNLNAILFVAFLIPLVLFVGLSASLDSNWLKEIDQQLSSRMNGVTAGPSAGFFAFVTLLGSDYVLGLVVVLACVLLYRAGRTPELIGMLAVGAGAKVLEHGLKLLFQRARPELLGPTMGFFGDYGFPSGHSLNSAAIYGFILLLFGAQARAAFWKYLIVVIGALLIVPIGSSRVILKRHWPSDVVGGWLVAGMLLSVVVYVVSMYKGRFDVRISSAKSG